jgi:RNA polymerase sigma-70 factor (ECF subfamily)
MSTSSSESLLIARIRAGEPDAWNEIIARYEGRLLGFVVRRVADRAAAEDVVQETFVGFLNSLPNYDADQPLEGYLFSIAAHKLTDLLRREGRRPTMPLLTEESSEGEQPPGAPGTLGPGHGRRASSIVRSRERHGLEETALVKAVGEMIAHWRRRGQWERLQCIELLWVRGWSNKEVAARLGISEQSVANYKFETIARLRTAIRGQGLPEEGFPELYQ